MTLFQLLIGGRAISASSFSKVDQVTDSVESALEVMIEQVCLEVLSE
jgi:hypothetical protein